MKYMSPEQALQPKSVTVRSDTFSLGVTLYELFTGQVLPSIHHVYEVMAARDSKGTTMSRCSTLGIPISTGNVDLCEMILEMHRRGVKPRPTIDTVRGHLMSKMERRFAEE